MGLSFKPLFHYLIDHDIKETEFRKQLSFSAPIYLKLKKDKVVNTTTISEICKVLKCQPSDIMEYVWE